MNKERIFVERELVENEDNLSLRPQRLSEYIGQSKIKETLSIYIQSAIKRNDVLDHILLYGPPGLGKTTLAKIISTELGSNIKVVSAPSIEKTGDLACILNDLEENDILFIDEIHRLPRIVEEILYQAMEDFVLDIVVGQKETTRTIKIDLPKFTLIGATTRYGDLTAPFRDRFGIIYNLEYYDIDELALIIKNNSKILNLEIDSDSCNLIANVSRGTPRIANRLLKRVRDYSCVLNNYIIDKETTKLALSKLGIDDDGFDDLDIKYLKVLVKNFNGGPVGIETLSISLSQEVSTLEDVYEPFLIKRGYITRTLRGRVATNKAFLKIDRLMV